MGTLELEDRIKVLEALATELMRVLVGAKLLPGAEVERLLDRVEERMIGGAGAVFAAQLLADGVGAERHVPWEEPEAPIRSAFRDLLYRTGVPS
ncbi:hypothetical protein [Methylobacterium sp. JK268]